jgi:hypothetical protein
MPASLNITYPFGGRRVADAIERDLLPCDHCGAGRGDPCRTPGDRTTEPHRGRLSAEEEAIASMQDDEEAAMAEASDAGEPENWRDYL